MEAHGARVHLRQLQALKRPHKTESDYQFWDEGKPKRLSNDTMMHQKLEYMHNNPAKRGYVDEPEHRRFKRYGFAEEAALVARDISRAASYFVFHRLPELYAGVKREAGTLPVQYLGANVPQAWAAGSVFHLLRALLGLDADAHEEKLSIDPALPHWLPEITVHKLRVGKACIDLRFWRDGETTRHEVLAVEGELEVATARSKRAALTLPGQVDTNYDD
jgi:hypothetical protein